jgi:GrpB-like predicted nucleotidyltransferase (UPF0157 family)
MTLGLEAGRVRVVPYSDLWPALYDAEIARVSFALATARVSLAFEHMGSTAVPGLAAKPIIDILAGLRAEEDRASAITVLQAAGYTHRGEQEIPGRDFFRRGDPRQYHIHLALIDGKFWSDHVTFRDWLRQHPSAAADYMALKLALAERYPANREAYIEGKSAFVADILRTAASNQQ